MSFAILYVCTGNICRSPLAQRLTEGRLETLLGDDAVAIRVSSVGTRALAGHEMDADAADQLRRLGHGPGQFRARAMERSLLREADLILTATRAHRGAVLGEVPQALRKTFTIREFADLVANSDGGEGLVELVAAAARSRAGCQVADYDICDPIGATDHVHATVAGVINEAVNVITAALAKAMISTGQ